MNQFFSYMGIGGTWTGFLSLIVLFLFFAKNKKKYERIIELYHEKGFLFYVPYHFPSLMGFFGSFALVYYFSCIKKKKKPLFMLYNNNEVYNFFDDVPIYLHKWMSIYYKITLFCISCIIFILIMAGMKYIFSFS